MYIRYICFNLLHLDHPTYITVYISGLKWVSSVSYLKWGFQALCQVQIKGLTFQCEGVPDASCIHSGAEAIESFSLSGNSVWEACVVMGASCVVYLLLFLIGMRFVTQKPHELQSTVILELSYNRLNSLVIVIFAVVCAVCNDRMVKMATVVYYLIEVPPYSWCDFEEQLNLT